MRSEVTAASSALAGGSSSSSFTSYHFASFAAMEVTVTMVPRFTMPRVTTAFGGRYGPFAPNYPVDVPLWLALHIRQTDTCTINPPPFVAVPYLRGVVEREGENEATFESLPFYFFEVVKKLCENSAAAEDVPHVAEVVRLVDEVKAIRRQKLQRSMAVFEAEGSPVFIPGIKLTNIVNHELEYLRASFAKVLQQSAEMKRRREQLVGLPIDSSTPLRPSGAPRPSEHGGLSSSGAVETPSITTTRQSGDQQITPTPDATATVTTASVTDASEFATTATEGLASPPVKKRRTLRQT